MNMKAISTRALRAAVAASAVMAALAMGGCTSKSADSKAAAPQAVSVEEVREQVRQFGMGGAEKDAAGEQFYEWGEAAHPALIQLAHDPTLSDEEVDVLAFIAGVYAHTPPLFDALRERISAMPDPQARDMRLQLLAQYEATPGINKPR